MQIKYWVNINNSFFNGQIKIVWGMPISNRKLAYSVWFHSVCVFVYLLLRNKLKATKQHQQQQKINDNETKKKKSKTHHW